MKFDGHLVEAWDYLQKIPPPQIWPDTCQILTEGKGFLYFISPQFLPSPAPAVPCSRPSLQPLAANTKIK